jgi:UDP-N-acetylmuramate dehydrogenase
MLEFPPQFAVKKCVPLAAYTSFKIGGSAEFFAEVQDQGRLIELAQFCWNNHIRLIPLGAGTNVFFSDQGVRGLVCVIQFSKIKINSDNILCAEAGSALADVVKMCIDKSLAGFEFAAGIPGTVGGAIYGNAGAYGKAVSDCLIQAHILTRDRGKQIVDNEYLEFAYRHSKLKKTNDIVLEAEFQLQPGNQKKITARIEEILKIRHEKLPSWDVKTAGSYFKNIKDKEGRATAAASYLDAVDSKQTHVGDAAIFAKHANIFINKGHATAHDVLELERILKERVQQKFNIILEREVMYIA